MARTKSNQKKETNEAAVQESAIVQEAPVMQEGAPVPEPEDQVPEVQVQEPPADTAPAPEPEPPEPFAPYTAKVGVPMLVLRRVPDPESKPIGTLHRGMKVEVVDSRDGYAKLKNGTWVSEAHLEQQK